MQVTAANTKIERHNITVAAAYFPPRHHLLFRGHSETLKTDNGIGNSGNFLDSFTLISKSDPTLREHMKRINDKQLAHHDLSHDKQNELIKFMSKTFIDEMIHRFARLF